MKDDTKDSVDPRLPRVYVTQEMPISYAPAEEYGEVVFLTSREYQQRDGSGLNADIVAEIARKLITYRPDTDYICPSGSPVAIGAAFFFAALAGDGRVKVLHWQRPDPRFHKNGGYVAYTVTLMSHKGDRR